MSTFDWDPQQGRWRIVGILLVLLVYTLHNFHVQKGTKTMSCTSSFKHGAQMVVELQQNSVIYWSEWKAQTLYVCYIYWVSSLNTVGESGHVCSGVSWSVVLGTTTVGETGRVRRADWETLWLDDRLDGPDNLVHLTFAHLGLSVRNDC